MAQLDLTQMYEDIEGLKSGDIHAGFADVADKLDDEDADYKLSVNLNQTSSGTIIKPGQSNALGIDGVLQPSNGGTGTTATTFNELVEKIVVEAGLKKEESQLPDGVINFTKIYISKNKAPATNDPGVIWIQLL